MEQHPDPSGAILASTALASTTLANTTLDSLAPLTRAEILSVDWNSLAADEGKRLRALGLDVGARVAIAHRGVFFGKDPIAIIIGRSTIAVRRAHARAMTVRAV